jgi:hypothetical protein
VSQRERWILYPLLFLALGTSLRDKLIPSNLQALTVDAAVVRCDRLEVVEREEGALDLRSRPRIIGEGGRLDFVTQDGRTVLLLGPDHSGKRFGLFGLGSGADRFAPLTLYAMPELTAEAPEAE